MTGSLHQRALTGNLAWWVCALVGLLDACGGGMGPDVPASITLTPDSISFTALGQTQQLASAVRDGQGALLTDVLVTWTSSNLAVATVTPTGLVTAQSTGSAEVTASAGSATALVHVAVAQTPALIQKTSGDGQIAVAGQPVSIAPAVLVQDANGKPVAGVPVTFEIVSEHGSLTAGSTATNNSGIAQVGSWTLGSKGANLLRATAAGAGISGNPVTFTATGTSSFNIVVRLVGSTTASRQQAFEDARARWESLVTGDLEDVPLIAEAGSCGPGSPAVNETVDDLLIFVTLEEIDGPGDILGSAGPCFIRTSNDLTILGAMRFDTADLDEIEAEGLLPTVILHEMGHLLGFGTLWPFQHLLADPSVAKGAGGADPHFTGAQAIAAFDQVGGSSYSGNKVPVEDTGGEGTADVHWRESVFGNELMTGFVNLGQNPLSIVTVASLADQGYAVNLAGADPYTLSVTLHASGSSRRLELGNDVLHLPIKRVDGRGRVVDLFGR